MIRPRMLLAGLRRFAQVLLGLGVLGLCSVGCRSIGPEEVSLRIGITPDYPPMIFSNDRQPVGIEAELGEELARRLNRPVEWVPLNWDQLIPALIDDKIDIIMSGMSITEARSLRVAFSDPYLKSAVIGLTRKADAGDFPDQESIENTTKKIGTNPGTTAEVYAREHCPNARQVSVALAQDAPFHLRNRRIDLFIHDAPSIAWLLSENEADLFGLWIPLSDERLAWALRRGDTILLEQVNRSLADMKTDGTLRAIVNGWIPYYDRLKVD